MTHKVAMSRGGVSPGGTSAVETVRAFHNGANALDDCALELALGIRPDKAQALPSLLRRFGNQNFNFAATSFPEMRDIFHHLRPQPHDIVCDAGAGHGHFVLYGACLHACRFRAIEIVPSRCAGIRKSLARLKLRNVDVVQADALAQDYAQASCVFVNNPFFPNRCRQFAERLAQPRSGPLTVVAINNVVDAFREDCRFVEVSHNAAIPEYRFGIFRLRQRRARPATPAGSA